MSQKKTNTQATPSTLTDFLTSPEMIQLVRDVAIVCKSQSRALRARTAIYLTSGVAQSKAFSAKLHARTANNLTSGIIHCKKLLASAKTTMNHSINLKPTEPTVAVDYDVPTILRKLGRAEFEAWQHLRGVVETPDTNIHRHAFNMSLY
ncbi:hypothetical protein AKN87_07300 [Thiopseudomonas alkaliphila]|uniref:hypothetical protein n=1 Tax=Thiopseudomonas alkaliphila TaxID=1697053 RepID=UPI00069EBE92|nr:hypothetical protein [Thiopseudomonas alkaliphila]AKX44919.1 hypothetical protein AKN87_07300 [Thiopseudomonas alkaliphila]